MPNIAMNVRSQMQSRRNADIAKPLRLTPTRTLVLSSAVARRNHVQVRSTHFFNSRSRYANVGEQPVIKFEKLPVLVSSFPPQGYSGHPRKRDFPEPSQVRKQG
jgi:hypothetical protein